MLVRIVGAAALAGIVAFGLAGAGVASDEVSMRGGAAKVRASSGALTLAPLFNVESVAARAPVGWMDFCERYVDECRKRDFSGERIVLDGDVRDLIRRVNSGVNAAITPATDPLQWGLSERWDFAETGVGDCEDYALLKQRWLVSAGLPRQALLVTVVTDLNGDGHAVLTLHTDRGDFILDNMHDEVTLWRETPYRFVKRQSRFAVDEWVSLREVGESTVVVSR